MALCRHSGTGRKEFGVKGKLPICGKINGIEFSASQIPRGNGEHYVVLDKDIRTKANIAVGDLIKMQIWKNNSTREVKIPDDFQSRLSE